jgi:SpoVK/Ycf46/Vps4 family AAA+-type ATPase
MSTKRTINQKSTTNSLSLQELILIGKKQTSVNTYNLNIEKLENVIPTLEKLNAIIGMDSAKNTITTIVLYYLQNLCVRNVDMMHTMIKGDSGTGKTMLARIIGEIYWKLGVLDQCKSNSHNVEKVDDNVDDNHRHLRKKTKQNDVNYINKQDDYDYDDGFMVDDNGDDSSFEECDDSVLSDTSTDNTSYKFIETSRSDFVDKYQGGTAHKVHKLFYSAIGGVIFIDEAYSLGNIGAEDTYNREAIDAITSMLEKLKGSVVVIFAGYKDAMENNLFHYNEGLYRRITFTIIIDSYTPAQLSEIFLMMVKNIDIDDPWLVTCSKNAIQTFFKTNNVFFPHFGGDIETLIFNVKMQHSLRLLSSHKSERKHINISDINNAFKEYKTHRAI